MVYLTHINSNMNILVWKNKKRFFHTSGIMWFLSISAEQNCMKMFSGKTYIRVGFCKYLKMTFSFGVVGKYCSTNLTQIVSVQSELFVISQT